MAIKDEIRTGKKAKQWMLSIFERDKYTCRQCGKKNCKLNAHHIQNWLDYPELRYNIYNGITLCLECHSKMHPKHSNLIKNTHQTISRDRRNDNGGL
jgi:hypothetical protein